MKPADAFPLAEVLREAVALNEAVLVHDLMEARHRARLIVTLAIIYDLGEVLNAANTLLACLSSSQTGPHPEIACVVDVLFRTLDNALE